MSVKGFLGTGSLSRRRHVTQLIAPPRKARIVCTLTPAPIRIILGVPKSEPSIRSLGSVTGAGPKLRVRMKCDERSEEKSGGSDCAGAADVSVLTKRKYPVADARRNAHMDIHFYYTMDCGLPEGISKDLTQPHTRIPPVRS